MKKSFLLLLLLPLCFSITSVGQTLTGFASLPANTFEPGPTSGQFIAPANGVIPPFADKQPVQGFSSVLRAGASFLVMSDNGFGSKETSPDYVLRVHRIDPSFKGAIRGTGEVELKAFMTLSDPDHKINFPIIADMQLYPGSGIEVDANIRQDRLLTGWDFDIESMRRAPDGTFWFGDEFGPFLVHTDFRGRVLDTPFPLPGVRSPQNPFLGTGTANLPRSKGFEGMAISPDGSKLYPMLEGPLTTDTDQSRLIIYEFDLATKSYSANQWFYRMEAAVSTGQAIGDLTAVNDHMFLVIERDNFEGAAAQFKKIFLVDFAAVDSNGFVAKTEVADLLRIDDPNNLGGQGALFRFPFTTIESVIPLNSRTLGVLNDNNYPFSNGRTPGQPDPNEFITIRLDAALPLAASVEQSAAQ